MLGAGVVLAHHTEGGTLIAIVVGGLLAAITVLAGIFFALHLRRKE